MAKMTSYRLSPYVSFVQHNLFPGVVHDGIAHRLTGEVIEPTGDVRHFLEEARSGTAVSLPADHLDSNGVISSQFKQLVGKNFLIPIDRDPLTAVIDKFVVRPIQNPAVTYRNAKGKIVVARPSLSQRIFTPRKGELPTIVEEELSPETGQILSLAKGDKTLREIYRCLRGDQSEPLTDERFRASIDFLTDQERQLIKFTSNPEDLSEPYRPVNIVPRNLIYKHGEDQTTGSIIDFHLQGIEDAAWEFDQIEPTVNHALRFPDEILGGSAYGARFCLSTLTPLVTPSIQFKKELDVLEVGGGTGTFARSFIDQARQIRGALPGLNYHIADLSPVLMMKQKVVLADLLPADRHFHQNAIELNLPDRTFDLIIANEVIADFPVASVHSAARPNEEGPAFSGDGVAYVEKYGLTTDGAPLEFKVNSGAMDFIERCWEHLTPGGTAILSEYGSTVGYPVQSYHLNHDEFSIQFTHLVECATRVGFSCRLQTLHEFLGINLEVPVFCGREEHIFCLNHVFESHGISMPYAIISETEFARRFGTIAEDMELEGCSFLPIKKGFYFGPRIEQFMVLIMNKAL